MKPKFRKTNSGRWAVMAPINQLGIGKVIEVEKANGTSSSVKITELVGSPFMVEGEKCAFGYFEDNSNGAKISAKTSNACKACAKAKRGGYYRQHLFDGCEECGDEADW